MTGNTQNGNATSVAHFQSGTVSLGAPAKVLKPIGAASSEVRVFEVESPRNDSTAAGVWECSPGRFERTVAQAEMCHFVEGEGSFTPEGGVEIDIRPGVVMLFPANTRGVWHVRKTLRKVFVVFDEAGKV